MLTKILNIGISEDLDFYQKRETKILNLFAFITIFGSLAGSVNVYILGHTSPAAIVLLELAASTSILVLNHKKQFHISDYLFVISMNLTLFFANTIYDEAAGNYLYYFPIIFCIALLHNPNKGKTRDIIFFGFFALTFFCSRFMHLSLPGSSALTSEQNNIIFRFNVNLVAILTVILVYLVIRLINRQYSELTDLLKRSQSDQLTIQNSLKEKDVLLAEIQHRVKNNLSVLIGLFNLQKNSTDNEEAKLALREAKNRVLSIAMVHEKLYKKDNLSHINLKHYISDLAKEIIRGHPLNNRVKIEEELADIMVDITKAVPIGLIVNESLTNSLKHGFSNESIDPVIKVSLTTHFGLIAIKVADNGKGFPDNDTRSDKSLGLTLIESLADQIDGEVRYSNNKGAVVKLSLPV